MFPITRSLAVTPDDDTDLAIPGGGKLVSRYVTCTTAGTLVYKNEAGDTSTADLAVGVLYPIACVRILETSTAQGIKVHW